MSDTATNMIRGHKANLSRHGTSQESKERSRQIVEEAEARHAERDSHLSEADKALAKGANKSNLIGGHKATLKNPRTTEEAKEHSQQVLEELGVDNIPQPEHTYRKDESHDGVPPWRDTAESAPPPEWEQGPERQRGRR